MGRRGGSGEQEGPPGGDAGAAWVFFFFRGGGGRARLAQAGWRTGGSPGGCSVLGGEREVLDKKAKGVPTAPPPAVPPPPRPGSLPRAGGGRVRSGSSPRFRWVRDFYFYFLI